LLPPISYLDPSQQLKAMLIRKREERKVRLSELIEERSQEIDDHASGRRLLNDEVSNLIPFALFPSLTFFLDAHQQLQFSSV
jgi:hypothetical protein